MGLSFLWDPCEEVEGEILSKRRKQELELVRGSLCFHPAWPLVDGALLVSKGGRGICKGEGRGMWRRI